ncbi:MAG: hypothetical protein JXB34_03435 [Bacteroidales bacterium]|nr:hypothetical protein [Bacteroidales bacterium]
MMHYKNTVEAVYVQLGELQQLVSNIGADGKIYTIEVDLAMDKLRHVYDLMFLLKNESVLSPLKNATTESKGKPLAEDVEKNGLPDGVQVVEEPLPVRPAESVGQKTEPEPAPEPSPEQESLTVAVKGVAKEETAQRTTEAKIFLGDTFKKEKTSLNEELSHQKVSGDIASQLKSKPITSISGAIGLNEKFGLIQNLFKGDKQQYEKTIGRLDAYVNYDEAFGFLSSNFGWDMDNAYVERLLELLRRKLIAK